jgi:hypothetical protein
MRFFGSPAVLLQRAKSEKEIVMQVVRFAAVRRNAVDIGADERRRRIVIEHRASLLYHLAARNVPDIAVLRFDMSARQQPPAEPAVMHEENAIAAGSDDEPGASDMSRRELLARERIVGALEEKEDQFQAFERFAIGRILERAGEGSNRFAVDHK